MARRAPAGRKAGAPAANYAFVVSMPMPPVERIAEIDAEARRVSAGRCGRWTSSAPDRLHVGFTEVAHRDAFVLWLTMSGIEYG